MSEITEQIGQVIKETRQGLGLTQKELGEKLGVSFQTINRYEVGQNFTVDTLHKIAQALGLSISDLVKGL